MLTVRTITQPHEPGWFLKTLLCTGYLETYHDTSNILKVDGELHSISLATLLLSSSIGHSDVVAVGAAFSSWCLRRCAVGGLELE
jgi:hypothetical protein